MGHHLFPLVETGWDDLVSQIAQCKESNIPHLIVDSADFRDHPKVIFRKVFKKLGLSFSETMSDWRQKEGIELGNLGGVQDHWYKRVLKSTGIQPWRKPCLRLTHSRKRMGPRPFKTMPC